MKSTHILPDKWTSQIKCRAGEVCLMRNNTLKIKLLSSIEISGDNAQEFIEAVLSLSSTPLSLLVDHRIPHSLTFEALMILSETKVIKALALLAKAGNNYQVAKGFKAFAKNYPVEVFLNEEKANIWLLGHL